MQLVPRMIGVALIALAFAGGTSAALADGKTPDNDSSVALPTLLLPSAQDPLVLNGLGPQSQMFSLQNGHLDFFSVRPESRSTDFTSLLGGGTGGGGGGLKLQFNW